MLYILTTLSLQVPRYQFANNEKTYLKMPNGLFVATDDDHPDRDAPPYLQHMPFLLTVKKKGDRAAFRTRSGRYLYREGNNLKFRKLDDGDFEKDQNALFYPEIWESRYVVLRTDDSRVLQFAQNGTGRVVAEPNDVNTHVVVGMCAIACSGAMC